MMVPLWIVIGIIIGAVVTMALGYIIVANYLGNAIGKAWGLPIKPWWKFW